MPTGTSGGTSPAITFKQIARVDEVVRTRGWNMAIADSLAEELGVHRRTVYRMKARAQRWTQNQLRPADLDKWRVEQVQFLADTALMARVEGDFTAAARCIDIQAKIIGTIAPTKVEVSGSYSVTHQAAIARVSHLSPAELLGTAQPAIEAEFEPVEPPNEPPR